MSVPHDGAEACFNGFKVTENPYAQGSKPYRRWVLQWQAALNHQHVLRKQVAESRE